MDVSATEALLHEIHDGLSFFIPAFKRIEREREHNFAECLAVVEEHYPGLNPLSDKQRALVALLIAAFTMYKPIVLGAEKPAANGEGEQQTAAQATASEQPWFPGTPLQ